MSNRAVRGDIQYAESILNVARNRQYRGKKPDLVTTLSGLVRPGGIEASSQDDKECTSRVAKSALTFLFYCSFCPVHQAGAFI